MSLNVWVYSPFKLLAQSLQVTVGAFGFHASLAREPNSEVALWDLSTISPPFPEPPSIPTLAICGGSESEKIALLHRHYRGYLTPEDESESLRRALQVLRRGEIWAEAVVVAKALDRIYHSHLTSREVEILHRVSRGLSNRVVAQQLGITERTVKAHVSSLFSKLGVHSRVELILHLRELVDRTSSQD